MLELLLDFGDEVLDIVKRHKGIEVEDVRAQVLGPLRAQMQRLAAEGSAPVTAENTNSMLPMPEASGM